MSERRDLEIGEGLALPLQWMTMATAVFGNRGTGKSTFGRVIAEEVVNHGQRFCALDIAGAFWGLKGSASGTDTGLPVVIFGGEHADVPLESGAGVQVADIVASISQSVILDFELMSKGKQIAFLGPFLERLYHVNRDPLLLLMDEAQRYAPQKPMSIEANKTLGATEDIVKLGRKHGLGPVVFTQRGAGLNKEVSELADVLVAFRSPGVLDQKRIREWLEANATAEQQKEVMAKISSLPTGTAIVASNHPDLPLFGTFAIRRPRTFDSSATPKPGQRRVEPKVLAETDIEDLKTQMAEAIERSKAEDPKELHKEINELRRQISTASWDDPKLDGTDGAHPAWWRGTDFGYQKGLAESKPVPFLTEQDRAAILSLSERLEAVVDQVDVTDQPVEVVTRPAPVTPPPVTRSSPPTVEPVVGEFVRAGGAISPLRPHMVRQPVAAFDGEMKLGKTELAILGVLGVQDGLTVKQLAFKTGYSAKSSGFGMAIGNLRRNGLIEPGLPLRITSEGIAHVPSDIELPPPPGPELIDYWMRKLGTAEQKILRVMADAHPTQLTMTEIAERAGYSIKSSGLGVAMGKLRSTKLVDGFSVSEDVIGR